MKRILIPIICLGLAGCAAGAIMIPTTVQTACQTAAWAVPLVQVLGIQQKLNPNQQQMLATAEQAVSDCAAGNAPAAITDIASGLVAILWPPKP